MERQFTVSFTVRGTMTIVVDVSSDDMNELKTAAALVAEDALQTLHLQYPGVKDFSATFADAEQVQEI